MFNSERVMGIISEMKSSGRINVRDITDYVKELENNIGHIEDAIEEIRSKKFDLADASKDNRYSVKVLVAEHNKVSEILEDILNTIIISEPLRDRMIK